MKDIESLKRIYSLVKSYNHVIREDDWEHVPKDILDIATQYEWVYLIQSHLDCIYMDTLPTLPNRSRGIIRWVIGLLEMVTDETKHIKWFKDAKVIQIETNVPELGYDTEESEDESEDDGITEEPFYASSPRQKRLTFQQMISSSSS